MHAQRIVIFFVEQMTTYFCILSYYEHSKEMSVFRMISPFFYSNAH